jgi:hypothetical protein
MTSRRCSEQAIQAAIFEHIAWRGVKGLFAFHVPLGGYRRPVEAKIFKSLGVVAGIPDLLILHDGRCYAIELKTELGRLTHVQRETHARMRAAGATVATCWGIDEAISTLEQWNLFRGTAS